MKHAVFSLRIITPSLLGLRSRVLKGKEAHERRGGAGEIWRRLVVDGGRSSWMNRKYILQILVRCWGLGVRRSGRWLRSTRQRFWWYSTGSSGF